MVIFFFSSHPFCLFLKVICMCVRMQKTSAFKQKTRQSIAGEKTFCICWNAFEISTQIFCFYLKPSRISMTPLKFPMFQDACINRKTQESKALLPGWLPLEMINCTTHSVTWKEGFFHLKAAKSTQKSWLTIESYSVFFNTIQFVPKSHSFKNRKTKTFLTFFVQNSFHRKFTELIRPFLIKDASKKIGSSILPIIQFVVCINID